ncbi:alpha-L-rhamnosidase-like protein [Anseongella ginsenosidimutans]|uniref:Alpha-L-rhamnosidase-like protein n=1 Tax=Anseongella ginsenosidimutans TaxID=496056 RepID=A0A4R3KUC6_9SPHI|nr:glycosyl hydrolase [Anseongella ginsenosidimutans]TCS88999.1 alpha-L-rhamnosidase-like protein [Anseongella ginsenosidimutans]
MLFCSCNRPAPEPEISTLREGFLNPPDSARPGVYWYFMDGNLSAEGMTADLESMKEAGIGYVVFLEVNVGVPRGPVDFLSPQWQDLFRHAVREAERLGIGITLGVGPGWTGSGGPWVRPAQSMQHLVSAAVQMQGGEKNIQLPLPPPRQPYFGEGTLTPELKEQWNEFYEDVAVLAFPSPPVERRIEDIDEKALYYRAPYTSVPGVKQFIPSPADYPEAPGDALIAAENMIDLTEYLRPGGLLEWEAPEGAWTVMRFGRRNNGAITRPAPYPGLGFEADKFDTVALNAHLDAYIGTLFRHIGKFDTASAGGLKRLHMDSWEMGAQNWTPRFREEFIKRRGYDPQPFYPVYAGYIIESVEISERFLWDLRQTSQELVLQYHAGHLKEYSHRHGLKLSIEPYDMNPNADMELGAVADVPMAEFWSKGYGFNSAFSCIEATSVAHVNGAALVPAEAFTADHTEAWKQHPASMKNQGDWAFATGINRLVYHTFQHQPLADSLLPGMTMGPYGVHWDRRQTWWPMAGAYHRYISRCQYLLQQGRTVADILYLTPEGAPHVFRAPSSALTGDDVLPDRKGFNFDGCTPGQLYMASVKDGRIVFPGGASYRVLVLPYTPAMTPPLLEKIRSLVGAGATVIGEPPLRSPGLEDFPACDRQVQSTAQELWGGTKVPETLTSISFGKGRLIWGGPFRRADTSLYPEYAPLASLLKDLGLREDFSAEAPLRYTHRTSAGWDIYFVSNTSPGQVEVECIFRSVKGRPELWDPLTGETRALPDFLAEDGQTRIPLLFGPHQSFFIVFPKDDVKAGGTENFPSRIKLMDIQGPWTVDFSPERGGPGTVQFDRLQDWTTRPEEGIRYYSGTAVYRQSFDFSITKGAAASKGDIAKEGAAASGGETAQDHMAEDSIAAAGRLKKAGKLPQNTRFYLDLGEVNNMARVYLNGQDMGVAWTAPWKVDITHALKNGRNELRIEVANLWPNRLIGDEQLPEDGIQNGQWPGWLTKGKGRTSNRHTFSTFNPYTENSPLLRSGLTGPVALVLEEFR